MTTDARRADSDLSRYVRQTVFAPLGPEGQRRLRAASVLICGCGALGSTLANMLVRAGVGRVRIVDRDRVDLHNLQRQVLFDEEDAAEGRPKALAAARRLATINSDVVIEPIVDEMTAANMERFAEGMDVMVDGTDNFPTRFLINDTAVKHGTAWVYGGCVAVEGQVMAIVPGRTPCLRCLLPEEPDPAKLPTCPTHGILGPTVGVIASLEAIEAMKLLAGRLDAVSRWLTVVNLWDASFRRIDVARLRESADCPACKHRRFDWLGG
ncbi:MAG: thiazole biosynthesis adenylyltransferase ThiF [Pirellulaceae bacterium]|nr:thiazole biosynthesis adenylyltransferase ThiF [Pirellulaceae bacterium]